MEQNKLRYLLKTSRKILIWSIVLTIGITVLLTGVVALLRANQVPVATELPFLQPTIPKTWGEDELPIIYTLGRSKYQLPAAYVPDQINKLDPLSERGVRYRKALGSGHYSYIELISERNPNPPDVREYLNQELKVTSVTVAQRINIPNAAQSSQNSIVAYTTSTPKQVHVHSAYMHNDALIHAHLYQDYDNENRLEEITKDLLEVNRKLKIFD